MTALIHFISPSSNKDARHHRRSRIGLLLGVATVFAMFGLTSLAQARAHSQRSGQRSSATQPRRHYGPVDTSSDAGGTGIPVRGLSTDATTALRPGSWFGSFAGGTFQDWTDWTQPQGGTMNVIAATAAGIPKPPSDDNKVAHFEVTPAELDANDVQSKLYKGWDVYASHRTDEAGRPFARMTNKGAGIYSAWYYLPRHYRVNESGPVDIFQFKEDYSDNGVSFDGFGSDVQSDLNLFSVSGLKGFFGHDYKVRGGTKGLPADSPMIAISLWHNPAVTPRPGHVHQAVPAPLGRWFNVTAKLYPGNRVEYFVDGRLLDTWYNDEYPVGVRYAAPGEGEPVAMGWTFGVGAYGSNAGQLWVADAAYTPFH